ncbi:MAG: DnaJ domain-containing protein [Desulfomonilia bacterium]
MDTMAKDYYRILGLSREATSHEIKKRYRSLAIKVHPDLNQGSPDSAQQFKEITEAYGVLIDPEKRKRYDSDFARSFEQEKVFEDVFARREFRDVFDDLPLKKEWIEKILNISRVFVYEALVYGGRPRDIIRRGLMRMAIEGAQMMFHGVMDIHEKISIPPEVAMRGGQITIEYRPGISTRRIRVKIPRTTRPGTVLKVQGMGRRNLMKRAGDLYLHVDIDSL